MRDGRGTLQSGTGRPVLAPRVSWELHNGPIPDGMYVCHHCDNPPCVRPDHLFLGTAKDNARDMARKGRTAPSRLGREDVATIKARVASGERQRDVGRDFGITQPMVSMIVNGHRLREGARRIDEAMG